MVSKYFQRTVLSHITFVGIGYLMLHAVWLLLFLRYGDYERGYGPPPIPFVFLITLPAAIFYSYRLRNYRPVPHNPIQQFQINLIIALYAVVVALSVVIPFCATLEHRTDYRTWPLLTAIYVFFAWRHVCHVDIATTRDIFGRSRSEWGQMVDDTKRSAQVYHWRNK